MAMATQDLTAWAGRVWEQLQRKLEAECARTGSNLPFIPVEGRYRDCLMPGGTAWWTNGFWPGILWQMAQATGQDAYAQAACGADARIAAVLDKPETLDHDVGFLFLPGSVAEYRLTGHPEARTAGLRAAEYLMGRFNPRGSFIRAWNKSPWAEDVSGWMIVDCMLNIPLLSWATRETGDPKYEAVARRHANTALRCLLRPDGSCHHIASFDAATGEFLGGLGGQGWGQGSSWARGQGWALYGFTLAYENLGDEAYRDAAKRSAHYCIAALAAWDWLPPADFRMPAEPFVPDSGAGALIACGLLALADTLPAAEQPLYRTAAGKVLQAIEAQWANWDPEVDGILYGGSMMVHNDRLAGQAFIYNDYFFLEAVLRLLGRYFPVWTFGGPAPAAQTPAPVQEPPRYSFAHVGLHFDGAAACTEAAGALCQAFGFPSRDIGASVIVAGPVELTKSRPGGAAGHLGIAVPDVEAAVRDLAAKGIRTVPDTEQRTPDGQLQSVYLDWQVGGFALHLLKAR